MYDLLVIGAGPGGYVAAIRAAQLGLKVACVEKRKTLGGTCLNIGCIPSKALLHTSEKYWQLAKEGEKQGLKCSSLSYDWKAVQERKEAVVMQLTKGIEGLFAKHKVTRLVGQAKFRDPHTVTVGSETIEASSILLATGSEPWRIPAVDDLPSIAVDNAARGDGPFQPYLRDPDTLARPWAVPGTAGLEHRIGGLEKADITGNVSYDPENHHRMQTLRAAKVAGIAKDIPPLDVFGPANGDLLILGWGSTYGAIRSAVERLQAEGHSVAHAHLRHLNPFPANTEEVVRSYGKVLIPEVNLGQLLLLIRARYLIDAVGYDRVRGKPFRIVEIVDEAEQILLGPRARGSLTAALGEDIADD